MPSNPNIALSVKAPQFRGPLETFSRVQQIAANNMAMQKAQREAAAFTALQDYSKGGGKLNTAEDIQAAARAGVDPSVAQKIAEQNLNLGKFEADQKKIVTERLFNRLGAVARAGELGSSNEWVNWLNDYSKLGEEEFREAGEFLTMTKGRYDPSIVKSLMAGAEKYFEKTTPQAQVKEIIGDQGQIGVINMGGGVAPTITLPSDKPASGGVGGPMEPVPMGAAGNVGGPYTNDTADILDGIVSAQNDRDYQDALALVERANPDMVAALRRAMPRFDPTRIKGIRAEFSRTFGGAPDQPGLVAGDRGGMGGPDISVPTSFRARVPAPPVGPQPRETAEEVYQKERARLRAQTEAGPKPLTAPQEAKLRANIAKDYKSARSTIEMMDGVSRAVNDVRNLSRDQKEAITGLSGYTYSILPSSRSADTKLKNLQGKVTEMGKAAASLTGAIGQMAVQEWRIVSDMIASLDVTGMEPADLDNQLDIIEGQAKRAASITRDAYENQYVEDFARYPNRFQLPEPSAAAPKAAPRGGKNYPVLTPEQVRKAPKGTKYYTTDGRFGVKP